MAEQAPPVSDTKSLLDQNYKRTIVENTDSDSIINIQNDVDDIGGAAASIQNERIVEEEESKIILRSEVANHGHQNNALQLEEINEEEEKEESNGQVCKMPSFNSGEVRQQKSIPRPFEYNLSKMFPLRSKTKDPWQQCKATPA